jgi:hypothetical protein
MRRITALRRTIFALLLMAVFLVTFAGSCDDSAAEKQRKESVNERTQVFNRAKKIAPTPQVSNFPLRKALVEFTKRQDEINHPWYVYILGLNGNTVAYYVAKTVPVNSCNFLSSTEDLRHDSDGGNVVLTAPSLDGIYYGGGGASAGCDSWFFFDAATNALIQIRGVNWYAADQPLRVEATAIKVRK